MSSARIRGGDAVVATIRNPKHMVELVKQGVEVAMLDLDTSPLADFEQTFKGADAIVFAAGSAEADPSSAIDSKGVRRTVLTATKAGVRTLCRGLEPGRHDQDVRGVRLAGDDGVLQGQEGGEQERARVDARLDHHRARHADRGQGRRARSP